MQPIIDFFRTILQSVGPYIEGWGTYIDPLISIVTLTLVIYTWWRLRKSYREVIESSSPGKPIVLDFHSRFDKGKSQGGWASDYEFIKYPLPDIDLDTPEGVEDDLMGRMEEFKNKHPELFGRLQSNDGNLVATITGSSSVLAVWIPLLHGVIGQFPRVTYPIQTGEGFVWSKPIDLQRVRLESADRLRAIVEFVQTTKPEEKT